MEDILKGPRAAPAQAAKRERDAEAVAPDLRIDHIALFETAMGFRQLRRRRIQEREIRGPGLTQAFSSRCANTGMSFELISREGEDGFLDDDIRALFDQRERSSKH